MAPGLISGELSQAYDRLLGVIAAKPCWVAFSGGVDSTLVLKASLVVNPGQVVALFADSLLQSSDDRENARQIADLLGVPLQLVEFAPLELAGFVCNSPERCYLCKKTIFHQFLGLLPVGAVLCDGTNGDDLALNRPGQRANAELGVVSPLVLSGLGKR